MAVKYDIILITGDFYVDHPSSGIGIITKVLREKGYKVGIIEKPDWKSDKDFLKLGKPRLFFGITSGAIDSMLVNYTPLKKPREKDKHNAYFSGIPDRAVIVYCNKIRQLFKGSKIVIGGIEASMRRFAHYDYWDNDLRKSILFDTRADILVYGNGEKQIIEIADRVKQGKQLKEIQGTCIISKELPQGFKEIPRFEEVSEDKTTFCKAQIQFSNNSNLAQKFQNRYILQYKYPEYTTKDLDWIYGLEYSRDIPSNFKEFEITQFSITTHRGCIGRCNFCSISLHQGDKIISRSEESILNEIKTITQHDKFKGFIDDLGGPSANMYGMDCKECKGDCISCNKLDRSHSRVTELLKRASRLPGIKKVFVRTGVRYDLAVDSDEYLKELANHVSGCLKIAPEHFSKNVLKLMNKDNDKFDLFRRKFRQDLKYYFMTAHPGSSMKEAGELAQKIKELKLENTESIQVFTPTPMTMSTCMYYTGLNPKTLETVHVPYTYSDKKEQKRILF